MPSPQMSRLGRYQISKISFLPQDLSGYCSKECQKAHWRMGHKAECEGFAAARAAGTTDGTGTVLMPEEEEEEEEGGWAGEREAREEKDGGGGASRNGGRRGPGKKM